ncbi:MAG: hypothetical protein JWM57_1066 [Phycisphaerales bacterium]|nr:hypothetical protein [Phycisphaerales bacterium]
MPAMNIRELIGKHSKASAAVVGVLVLGAGYYAYRNADEASLAAGNTYFSRDEGKSFFADDGKKAGGLERSSPPAYRAIVASCDGGSHRFVAYLVRTPRNLLSQIDKLDAEMKALPASTPTDVRLKIGQQMDELSLKSVNSTEVLRPGQGAKWVAMRSADGLDIQQNIKCPPGMTGAATLVNP